MRILPRVALAATSLALLVASGAANCQAARIGAALSGPMAHARVVMAANNTGGTTPSGRYACDGGNYVDIRANEYRGPTFEPSGAYSPYVMGAGNSVTWTAGFGEISVVSTQYKGVSQDSTAQPWFTVTYNRTHGGGVDSVDCEREGA